MLEFTILCPFATTTFSSPCKVQIPWRWTSVDKMHMLCGRIGTTQGSAIK